jgi:hypothetical protein
MAMLGHDRQSIRLRLPRPGYLGDWSNPYVLTSGASLAWPAELNIWGEPALMGARSMGVPFGPPGDLERFRRKFGFSHTLNRITEVGCDQRRGAGPFARACACWAHHRPSRAASILPTPRSLVDATFLTAASLSTIGHSFYPSGGALIALFPAVDLSDQVAVHFRPVCRAR